MRRIRAKTRSKVIGRIVIVRARPYRRCGLVRFPFILRGDTNGTRVLFRVAIVANRGVIRKIILVLRPNNGDDEERWGFLGVARVRTTYRPDRVFHLSMYVHVLLHAVVAIAINVLSKEVREGLVLMFFPGRVVARSTAVSSILNLFNSVHFIQLRVGFVPSTTRLVHNVVFRASATRLHEAMVNTRPRYVRVRLSRLQRAIPIHVVQVAIPVELVRDSTVHVIF